MKFNLKSFNLRKEMDTIQFLFFAHLGIFFFSIVANIFYGASVFWNFVLAVAGAVVYKLYYDTLKDFRYTFWTFSILVGLYFIAQVIGDFDNQAGHRLDYLNLLGLMFLGFQCYLLFSPLYYPLVSWWEYDFRYRDDITVDILHDGVREEGRLNDMRRNACCVSTFNKIEPGQEVEVFITDQDHIDEEASYRCEVMTVRRFSLGRPFTHGVRIKFRNNSEKSTFEKFCHNVRKEKRKRNQKRFAKES